MSKLIITDGILYIGENKDDYFTTEKSNEAKDFKWCWLFFSEKIFLEGIKKRFGNKFEFEYLG